MYLFNNACHTAVFDIVSEKEHFIVCMFYYVISNIFFITLNMQSNKTDEIRSNILNFTFDNFYFIMTDILHAATNNVNSIFLLYKLILLL